MTAAPPTAPAPAPPREEGRAGAGRHRAGRRRSAKPVALVGSATALVVAAAAYFHFGPLGRHTSPTDSAAGHFAPDSADGVHPGAGPTSQGESRRVASIPGLGPAILSAIPHTARQIVLASGHGIHSSDTTVTLWTKGDDGGWRPGTPWPAHNALRGWTRNHHVNDLHSPIGVFTLSDAGGLKRNPGTRLPYHRSNGFDVGGTGFHGEALNGSFDYVVAIDYNRVPGTSPLDGQQPMGTNRGGGIWIHVDHGGPTHGCVSLSEQHMTQLLRALNPKDHPVIVMGDRGSLAK
jgi:L,D-peptidoglycan transpeptidase YkuD (ErfK/YbiS/YcfS/YnhG family)